MAQNENKAEAEGCWDLPLEVGRWDLGIGGLRCGGEGGGDLIPNPQIPEVVWVSMCLFSKMMLQHPGQVSASEVSASAIGPCLSPPGSLVFEDFANLTPFVKEELRFAIQSKHLCHRMSSALDSVTVSGRPLEMSVTKAEVGPPRGARSSCTYLSRSSPAPGMLPAGGHGWILGLEFREESGLERVLEAIRVWRVWKAMNLYEITFCAQLF